jgi:1,4-alpha-glucan branching enzyme
MGNEFGHPEWIDFPREGNGWSYHYARRNWTLVNPHLRYWHLNLFDKAMLQLFTKQQCLSASINYVTTHNRDQILAFMRGNLLFVFNFSPVNSYPSYSVQVPPGEYQLCLNSDSELFGGFNRIDETVHYFTFPHNNKAFLQLYLPARSAVVVEKM